MLWGLRPEVGAKSWGICRGAVLRLLGATRDFHRVGVIDLSLRKDLGGKLRHWGGPRSCLEPRSSMPVEALGSCLLASSGVELGSEAHGLFLGFLFVIFCHLPSKARTQDSLASCCAQVLAMGPGMYEGRGMQFLP